MATLTSSFSPHYAVKCWVSSLTPWNLKYLAVKTIFIFMILLLDSVEHITGTARYSAPGMEIISLRSEDLLEDLELEVRLMSRFVSLQSLC